MANILNFTTFFLFILFYCCQSIERHKVCVVVATSLPEEILHHSLEHFFVFWRGRRGEDLLRPWVITRTQPSHIRTDDGVFDNVVKQAVRLAACSKHTGGRSERGPFCRAEHTPATGKQMEACLFWALKPQHASHTGHRRQGGGASDQPQVSVRRCREHGGVKTKREVLDGGYF